MSPSAPVLRPAAARRLPRGGAGRLPVALALALAAAGTAPAAGQVPAGDAPPTEKALVARFHEDFTGSDPARLAAALDALAADSRRLEDEGRGKLVARLLAKGARQPDPAVRRAAVEALAWGRHVETTLDTLEELLKELHADVARLGTNPSGEARRAKRDAARLFARACEVLAGYPDDRAVDVLVARIRVLQRDTTSSHTSALLVGPLASALLRLGTRDAVWAVVRQTQTFVGGVHSQSAPAQALHRELAAFVRALGGEPPAWSEQFDVSWGDWFREHEDAFPDELGRLALPPPRPVASAGPPEARRAARDG